MAHISTKKRVWFVFPVIKIFKALAQLVKNIGVNIAVSVRNMKVLKSEGHLQTPLLKAGKTWQTAGNHTVQVCKFKCSTSHTHSCLKCNSTSQHFLLRKCKIEKGRSGTGELQSNTVLAIFSLWIPGSFLHSPPLCNFLHMLYNFLFISFYFFSSVLLFSKC